MSNMFEKSVSGLFSALQSAFREDVTYTPAHGVAFGLTGIIDRGAAFERAHPGLYCSVFTLLSNFSAPPKAGDEIQVGDAICQVVKEMDRDAFGGITLYARFVRLAP